MPRNSGNEPLDALDDDETTIRGKFKEEWRSRTWYGKLWYPLWAFGRLMVLLSLAMIVFLIAPGAVGEAVGKAISPVTNRVRAALRSLRGLTPETHKHE